MEQNDLERHQARRRVVYFAKNWRVCYCWKSSSKLLTLESNAVKSSKNYVFQEDCRGGFWISNNTVMLLRSMKFVLEKLSRIQFFSKDILPKIFQPEMLNSQGTNSDADKPTWINQCKNDLLVHYWTKLTISWMSRIDGT